MTEKVDDDDVDVDDGANNSWFVGWNETRPKLILRITIGSCSGNKHHAAINLTNSHSYFCAPTNIALNTGVNKLVLWRPKKDISDNSVRSTFQRICVILS